MGLDVYLRKCANLEAAKADAAEAEKLIEALWVAVGGYDKATEKQREEIRAKSEEINKAHGLTGKWGHHHTISEYDDKPSSIDPEHMFKVGYFRSSYNPGGINNILRNLGLLDLDGIFQPNDEYEFKPDWEASLKRCEDTIKAYEAHLSSDIGRYGVVELRPMYEHGAADEKSALEIFAKELGKNPFDGGGYSNRDGEFFVKPMRVRAVITKTYKRGSGPLDGLLNRPTSFLIYEKEDEGGKEDWYLTALKIVRETIEFVLAQPDKQHFYLTWSG